MNLAGRRVAIVGLGTSGVAAAKLCGARGAVVTGFDEAPEGRLSDAARALDIEIVCGPLSRASLSKSETVVVSPGVPRHPALELDVEVIGEVELASRFVTAPIALVGGTNGKSTVTALVGDMLERSGQRVFVGGNYGVPFCDAIDEEHDALVVEISSFQAERVPTLRARVHALLNISEDHLDRYDDFDDYACAKGNPFANMAQEEVAVIPARDAACEIQARRGTARHVTFAIDGAADVALTDEAIVTRRDRFERRRIRLRGRHNLANACAAIAVATELGASSRAIADTLANFAGLPHRAAFVASHGGVAFYDDSKATNVGAAVAALSGLEEQRVVLIAGGRDKRGAYEPLAEALRRKGRGLVLIGEAAEHIAAVAVGIVPIHRADSMEEAVSAAATMAQSGDAVLLSPACSSFDMFASYKARGESFVRSVAALGGSS